MASAGMPGVRGDHACALACTRQPHGGRSWCSEDLLEPAEEAAGWSELLGKDTDAGAVAQHVVVAEHVDPVEAHLERAEGRQGEALGQADVELLIRRVGGVVRVLDT